MSNEIQDADIQSVRAKPPKDRSDLIDPTGVGSYHLGLWVLCLGFIGFLLWAGLAPLDEGVPAPGSVVIDTRKKSVQHLTGGIIKAVLVKEGEQVKRDQVLIRLDEANARANFESLRQRYIGLRATQGRLIAEQTTQDEITFHPDIIDAGRDPQIQGLMMNQKQLFLSRKMALRADLAAIDENKRGLEGLISAYESMLLNRNKQQALLNEELFNTRGLVEEGYVPRNRQLELERMILEVGSGISELNGNRIKAIRAVGELVQRAIGRKQEHMKEIESQLADVGRDVESELEKYVAARNDLDRIDIKSPDDGQVVGLEFQTVGGVIGSGQKLMDIVQQQQTLLVEVRLPTHLIDRVKSGLHVDVRFSAFSHTPQLVVEGIVQSVSADALIDQRTGYGYYLARVAISDKGKLQLGSRILQSGMPAEVIFLTGERTFLKYILSPLSTRIAASLKEE